MTEHNGRPTPSWSRERESPYYRGAARPWTCGNATSRAARIAWLLDHAHYGYGVGERLVQLAGSRIHLRRLASHRCRPAGGGTRLLDQALALAGQAQTPQIQVHALSNLALHEVILRRPRRALRYVAAAERALLTQPAGRIRPMLMMRRARLLAMTGDGPRSTKSLRRRPK